MILSVLKFLLESGGGEPPKGHRYYQEGGAHSSLGLLHSGLAALLDVFTHVIVRVPKLSPRDIVKSCGSAF